jgi:dipeptidyl aminopeptidase/acylaminoacyl peptidase
MLLAAILLFSLMMNFTGCDITNLLENGNQTNEQTKDGRIEDKNSSVFQSEDKLSEQRTNERILNNLVKINPDIQYEIVNKDGYYLIGPLSGHLINANWDSSNSFNFRIDDGKAAIISKGRIDENGVKINTLIEAPSEGIYINEWLKDERGLVFISLMDEKNFYWYRNNELKEYKNVQYYYISPLQKYIVLFSGDYKTKPVLIELASGKEIGLPIEIDHGWPVYTLGMSFNADESKLLYEDLSRKELCIYDIKGQKVLQGISEKGYSIYEAAFSPSGKMIAYLKQDDNQPITYMNEEVRSSLGHKLVVYDLEMKKVIKEIEGEPFVYLRPIWSPNGKFLIVNMAEISVDKEARQKLFGNPYLLNIDTGKIKKLSNNETVLKYVTAWSDDNRKVITNSTDTDAADRISAIDINIGDEFNIDISKYYISRLKKSGTKLYEIISIENSKLDQFIQKNNKSLSTDENYIIFSTTIDSKEYIIVGPRQAVSK